MVIKWLSYISAIIRGIISNSWQFFAFIVGGGAVVLFWNFFTGTGSIIKTVLLSFLNAILSGLGVSDQFDVTQAFIDFNNYMQQWSAILPVKLIYTCLIFLFSYYFTKTIINISLWIVRRFIDIIP